MLKMESVIYGPYSVNQNVLTHQNVYTNADLSGEKDQTNDLQPSNIYYMEFLSGGALLIVLVCIGGGKMSLYNPAVLEKWDLTFFYIIIIQTQLKNIFCCVIFMTKKKQSCYYILVI